MPAKIDRLTAANASPRIERAAPAATVEKVAELQRPAAPASRFLTGAAPALVENRGPHIARSAAPDALWGAAAVDPNQPSELAKLSPADQKAKLVELTAQKDELQGKIEQRVEVLDKKWNRSRVSTRHHALREYHERSRHLDPAARRALRAELSDADWAQKRIDRLQARIAKLPPSRQADAETKVLRAELNKELREARSELSSSVKDATKLVDAQGLKVDRLGVTEQIIDPSAPKPGAIGSLLAMVKDFFHLGSLVGWLSVLIKGIVDAAEKSRKEEQKMEKLINEQRQVEDMAAQRRLLEQLATKKA